MDLKDYPVLVVAWGCVIQLYQMNQYVQRVIEGINNDKCFTIIGHSISDHSTLFIDWISRNMIICMNSRKAFKIMYTGDFQPGEYDFNNS